MALSDEYYDLIMPYVPKEVKAVISNQREIIDRKIDEKVTAFSESLVEEIDKRTKQFYDGKAQEIGERCKAIETGIDALIARQTGDATELKKAADELKMLNREYKDELTNLGKGIRLAAFGVASAAGLKLPYGKINEFLDAGPKSPPPPKSQTTA